MKKRIGKLFAMTGVKCLPSIKVSLTVFEISQEQNLKKRDT